MADVQAGPGLRPTRTDADGRVASMFTILDPFNPNELRLDETGNPMMPAADYGRRSTVLAAVQRVNDQGTWTKWTGDEDTNTVFNMRAIEAAMDLMTTGTSEERKAFLVYCENRMKDMEDAAAAAGAPIASHWFFDEVRHLKYDMDNILTTYKSIKTKLIEQGPRNLFDCALEYVYFRNVRANERPDEATIKFLSQNVLPADSAGLREQRRSRQRQQDVPTLLFDILEENKKQTALLKRMADACSGPEEEAVANTRRGALFDKTHVPGGVRQVPPPDDNAPRGPGDLAERALRRDAPPPNQVQPQPPIAGDNIGAAGGGGGGRPNDDRGAGGRAENMDDSDDDNDDGNDELPGTQLGGGGDGGGGDAPAATEDMHLDYELQMGQGAYIPSDDEDGEVLLTPPDSPRGPDGGPAPTQPLFSQEQVNQQLAQHEAAIVAEAERRFRVREAEIHQQMQTVLDAQAAQATGATREALQQQAAALRAEHDQALADQREADERALAEHTRQMQEAHQQQHEAEAARHAALVLEAQEQAYTQGQEVGRDEATAAASVLMASDKQAFQQHITELQNRLAAAVQDAADDADELQHTIDRLDIMLAGASRHIRELQRQLDDATPGSTDADVLARALMYERELYQQNLRTLQAEITELHRAKQENLAEAQSLRSQLGKREPGAQTVATKQEQATTVFAPPAATKAEEETVKEEEVPEAKLELLREALRMLDKRKGDDRGTRRPERPIAKTTKRAPSDNKRRERLSRTTTRIAAAFNPTERAWVGKMHTDFVSDVAVATNALLRKIVDEEEREEVEAAVMEYYKNNKTKNKYTSLAPRKDEYIGPTHTKNGKKVHGRLVSHIAKRAFKLAAAKSIKK